MSISSLNKNCSKKYNVCDIFYLGSTQKAAQGVYWISLIRWIRAFISHLKNVCHKRISSAFIEVHPLASNLLTGIKQVLHSNSLSQSKFSKIKIKASLVRLQFSNFLNQINFCQCSSFNKNCSKKNNVIDMVHLGST